MIKLMKKLEWSAPEYEERRRSPDWFWALGIIIATSIAAAVIYGNYFFAALIGISGLFLFFFAMKKPEMVSYELNELGLKVGNDLYPYEGIKAFWVEMNEIQTDPEEKSGNAQSIFFIKSERFFMPIISIPIENATANDIRLIMLAQNVPEEKMTERPSHKIMEALGL